jgi:hypothetical protein
MNLLRKTATTLGGIFFAVLLIAALAPKATRGIAAALVQIANGPTSPVPVGNGQDSGGKTLPLSTRDAENPAHNVVRLTGTITVPAGSFDGDATLGTLGQVPPGTRMVIEYFGANCPTFGNSGIQVNEIILTTSENVSSTFTLNHLEVFNLSKAFVTSLGEGRTDFNLAAPVRIYTDGSSGFSAEASVFTTITVPAGAPVNCSLEVSGYLVNLP